MQHDNDLETANSLDDRHYADYRAGLTTLDFVLVCEEKGKSWTAERQIGSWLATHFDCPHCGVHFRVINPEPTDYD